MIANNKVLGIITARGGSKGLPGKNIRPLCGKPLIGWPITAARQASCVDRLIVSTDSREIARIAVQYGADVPFLRPAHLATSQATSFSVLQHAIEFLSDQGDHFDYCVLLEPTSPLTEAEDIDKAYEMLVANRDKADSIVGIAETEASHPDFSVRVDKSGLIRPYHADAFSPVLRRQEIDACYHFEGSLYISDIRALMKHEGFYHSRTFPFIVPKWKAFEIDDIIDFVCVEAICRQRVELKKGSL